MKFSIITAVYNNKKYIEDCINSVISQDYNNIEYIIIDGGSDDGTTEIIYNAKCRIENEIVEFKFISEKDNGIYEALNKGLKIATGDVIGFLHSDDIFNNEYVISKIAKVFEDKNTDSVYSDLVYVYKDNPDKVLRYWKSGGFNSSLLNKGWMPPHPAFFVKKNIYDKYGGFDTSFKIASDYEIVLRFLAKHKISVSYLPEVTIKMRAGGASNKNIPSIIKKSREDYRVIKANSIPFPLFTLFLKNMRKLNQFVVNRRG